MSRLRSIALILVVAAMLLTASGCQRMVDVQTGTRVVDEQGRVVSENVRTVRVSTAEAGKYRVVTVTENSQAEALYNAAQQDIAAGDTEAAAKKLAELLAVQPDYRNAKVQLAAIQAGKKVVADTGGSGGSTGGSSGGSSPSTPKPPASKDSTPTAGGLLRWIPELSGYRASKAAVDPLSVSRQYTPSSSGDLQSLVVVAEQFRNADAAKAALRSQVQSRYTGSDATFKIGGHNVYFGTDARQFAVIGFTDGAVMVAAEGMSASGSPKDLRGVLTEAVKQLP